MSVENLQDYNKKAAAAKSQEAMNENEQSYGCHSKLKVIMADFAINLEVRMIPKIQSLVEL